MPVSLLQHLSVSPFSLLPSTARGSIITPYSSNPEHSPGSSVAGSNVHVDYVVLGGSDNSTRYPNSSPPPPARSLPHLPTSRTMSFDTPLPPYNSSDPHASFLNSTALDLLLIEIVPLARRLATEVSAATSPEPLEDEEEEREAMFYRLEQLGYKVGQGLVERSLVFSKDREELGS